MKKVSSCILLGACAALAVAPGSGVARAEPVQTIYMPDYWPNLGRGQKLIKHISTNFYGAPFEGMRSIYVGRSRDVFTKTDYLYKSKGVYGFHDTWHLRRTGDRLIEFRDDFKGEKEPIRLVFKKGREIQWGGNYSTRPDDKTVSNTLVLGRTGGTQFGYVSNKLETVLPVFKAGPYTYKNVAVIYHYQVACLDAQCNVNAPIYNAKGAQTGGGQVWEIRFWLAPEKGIVQTQYLKTSNVAGDPTRGRIDYVSNMCEADLSQKSCE